MGSKRRGSHREDQQRSPRANSKNDGRDGEDDEDPMPATLNLDASEMIPTGTGSTTPHLFG